MSIDYALGYHEAWEAWLHAARAAWLLAGKQTTSKEEQTALEQYLTKNRKVANLPALCSLCSEEIASDILEGKDPFETPQFARDAIKAFTNSRRKF